MMILSLISFAVVAVVQYVRFAKCKRRPLVVLNEGTPLSDAWTTMQPESLDFVRRHRCRAFYQRQYPGQTAAVHVATAAMP
jgi:hypothetical protein